MRHYGPVTALATLAASPAAGAAPAELVASAPAWSAAVAALSVLLAAAGVALLVGARRSRGLLAEQQGMMRELEHAARTEQMLREAQAQLEARVNEQATALNESYRRLEEVQTELAEARRQLAELVRVDALTGLSNRTQFDQILDSEIKRSIRERKPLSVMLCDVDSFDEYNRCYGRERGDRVLRKVAGAINNTFRRAADTASRFGGDQFAVVLPQTDNGEALRFAERVRSGVWELCIPHSESQHADRVTVSVGVATIRPNKLYKTAEVIAAARQALDTVKEQGRNGVNAESEQLA